MNAANPWPVALLAALISGGLTGTLALIGVVLTQRATAKREATARLWQQRQEAHAAFLAEQQRMDAMLMNYDRIGEEYESDGPLHLSETWYHPLNGLLVQVELVADQAAAVAARRLYRATMALEEGTVGPMAEAHSARDAYRRAVQRELGLPPTDLPAWGQEDEGGWAQVGRD